MGQNEKCMPVFTQQIPLSKHIKVFTIQGIQMNKEMFYGEYQLGKEEKRPVVKVSFFHVFFFL